MIFYRVSKEVVKNYLISRSFLVEKAESVLDVLERFKCLQVDPINVVARTHELSLYNRVSNFKISDLYKELYEKRTLFEYWLQLFSVIPVKYLPYLSVRREVMADWHEEFYKKHKKEIKLVLEFIKENGVSSSKELSHIPKVSNLFSWSNDSSGTAALEYLWDKGLLMIHHREKNWKFYDLTDRIIPQKNLVSPTPSECLEFLLKSRFDYLGIVGKRFLRGRLGYIKKLNLDLLMDKLLKENKVIKLDIKDVKADYFVLDEQFEEIKKLGGKNLHKKLNILPPLDPLIIDRKLLKDIFGFEYTWEAYTPPSKRKFGYYSMPILYKGNFVGQINLRKTKDLKLDILNLVTAENGKEFREFLKSEILNLENFIKS